MNRNLEGMKMKVHRKCYQKITCEDEMDLYETRESCQKKQGDLIADDHMRRQALEMRNVTQEMHRVSGSRKSHD